MPKAERDGVYRLGRGQFKVRKGDALPEGAEMVDERKKDAAPENRKKSAAPESKKAD